MFGGWREGRTKWLVRIERRAIGVGRTKSATLWWREREGCNEGVKRREGNKRLTRLYIHTRTYALIHTDRMQKREGTRGRRVGEKVGVPSLQRSSTFAPERPALLYTILHTTLYLYIFYAAHTHTHKYILIHI